MNRFLRNTIDKSLDVLFPVCCPVCGDIVVPKGRRICSECKKELPYLNGSICLNCGRRISEETEEYCEICKNFDFSFERGTAVFEYDDLMRKMIGDFKFRSHKEYAAFFADELAERYRMVLDGLEIQALVPVPIHSSKKRFRGFNQSEILCKELSKRLDLPIYNSLKRVKKTLPQKELDPTNRKKNLADAMNFAEPEDFVRADFKPERVLLVDDIYTTGSTAEVCTEVLKSNGIKQVYLLNIAIGNKSN